MAIHKFVSLAWKRLSGLVLLSSLLSSCADAPSTLAPQGPGAEQIEFLWWLMFWLATAVFIIVMIILAVGLFRPRSEPADSSTNHRYDRLFIIAGGIIVPLIILLTVYVFALRSMDVLASAEGSEELVIEVIGWQWWWEVRYPNDNVVTANELHIPVNTPVTLKVISYDVIHSFWVPELHGKIDMIPGKINTFTIEANAPGAYYGECAEFCGIQHAKMAFFVVAEPADQFNTWLEQQSQLAASPESEAAQQGQEVFLGEPANCAECHTVRGTPARGALGPDLTHLASRRSLAAGILPNTPDHLADWILYPQEIKPGNLMPTTDLTEAELQTLVAYLESLE